MLENKEVLKKQTKNPTPNKKTLLLKLIVVFSNACAFVPIVTICLYLFECPQIPCIVFLSCIILFVSYILIPFDLLLIFITFIYYLYLLLICITFPLSLLTSVFF